MNRNDWPSSLNAMYRLCGISKQGFNQYWHRHNRHAEEQAYIIELIRDIRKDHPTMCCRYMYYKINPVFMGRDRFEALCRAHGFTAKRKRSPHRTTDSSGVKRFDNLVEDLTLNRINQVWSSDITYFDINGSYYYLTFIVDCYSRKILGHSVSSRLLTQQTTLPALQMALKHRSNVIPPGMIFHSDGGGQYYDKCFLELTDAYQIRNSMCKMAYQNGKAERVNGTIKNNYLRHWKINSLSDLTRSVDRAVRLYNQEKPHSSLNKMSPKQFENRLLKLDSQHTSVTRITTDATKDYYSITS
jgi:transposase InsO family protein